MPDSATPIYGAKVDPAEVSYEPAHYQHDSAGNAVIEPPYYYLIADQKTRVVWVQPTSETGVDTRGWFALFTGDEADYAAVVPEAA